MVKRQTIDDSACLGILIMFVPLKKFKGIHTLVGVFLSKLGIFRT